jgi:hypothetical protein
MIAVSFQNRRKKALFSTGLWLCMASLLLMGSNVGGQTFEKDKLTPVNRPSEIRERLARCWQAPRTESSQAIEVTVRLSFSRAGAVIGEPRVTYIHSPTEMREKIAESILAAIKACTPLPFTPALGAAIAGRMFAIRFDSLPLTGRQRIT